MADYPVLSKLVWGGALAGTESWSCSLHFGSDTQGGWDPVNISAALTAWWTDTNGRLNKLATLDFWKFNTVDKASGRYLDPNNAYTVVLTPTGPGTFGVNTPPQLSIAVSLHTALGRGRMSKGRIFPPSSVTAADIGPDGRLDAPSANLHTQGVATLLRSLNAAVPNGRVIIWSQVALGGEPVVKVGAGRVVDTQQRRRKSIKEEPVFVSL